MSSSSSQSSSSLDGIMVGFYSLPPSPTKKPSLRSSYNCDLGANQTNLCHIALGDGGSSYLDNDFEFDTDSQLLVDEYELERPERKHDHRHYSCKGSFPKMAFVDELFCDGQVIPLRPPPRFFYANDDDSDTYGSLPATPRSISLLRKISFPRRSLWNDTFDPFTTALENVKLEKRGKSSHEKSHRRARSMSPMEPNKEVSVGCNQAQEEWPQVDPIFSPRTQMKPTGPYSIWAPGMTNGRPPILRPNKDQKGPMKLAEPKGVIFARRARMVKMDYDWPKKPNMAEATTKGKETKGDKKKNKKKIKKFLSKSYSKIKAIDEHLKQEYEAQLKILKSKNFRKKSTKSLIWAQAQPNFEEKDQATDVTKIALVHYKPKLLLCMGFEAQYAN